MYKKRKASLLFDILMGIAAMILIISVTMPTIRNEQFLSDFKTFIKKNNEIIKETILDSYKGYPSVNNSFCAPDYINAFKDITAYRVLKCTNLDSTINYNYDSSNSSNEKDPTKSYLIFMNNWINQNSTSDTGCKTFIGEGNTTSNFNIYFDCSAIRKPAIADSELLVYFKKNYPTKLIGYNINALSIDPAYVPLPTDHPSDTDGKLLLEFQK